MAPATQTGCPHARVIWLLSTVDAWAVTMAWSPVGNAGNAPDPATGSLYGAVAYNYNIGTYDVTSNQVRRALNGTMYG